MTLAVVVGGLIAAFKVARADENSMIAIGSYSAECVEGVFSEVGL
jgi:hypothetical protein